MVTLDDLLDSLKNNLSRDLLSDHWARAVRPDAPRTSGHCAIAAEALYFMLGGAEAGFTPYVCKYHLRGNAVVNGPGTDPLQDQTHWWVRGPLAGLRGKGAVIDATACQFAAPFPYHGGRGCGFQSPNGGPSRRAQTLINRIERECGAASIAAFRRQMIAEYKKAQAGYSLRSASL